MSRNVLSGDEVRFLSDGFSVENGSWKEEILRRAQDEQERRRRSAVKPVVEDDSDVLIPRSVFSELGSDAPVVEAVDPRQVAADEAESMLAQAREEAEAIASNIKEDAKARAAMMVEKAQNEAKETLQLAKVEAEAEIQRIKSVASEEGRREGVTQGTATGLEQGRAEGKAEYAQVISEWNSVLGKTVEDRKRALNEMQSLVVELVGEALYQCLKDEAVRNQEMVLRFVEEALKRAHDRVHLTVHLNPADLQTVEAVREKMQVAVGSSQITLVSDGRVEKGGCLLETEAGSIDARLSTVVQQVKETLSPGA